MREIQCEMQALGENNFVYKRLSRVDGQKLGVPKRVVARSPRFTVDSMRSDKGYHKLLPG